MAQTQVSIGRVKRDISDLVNRVAYGGERIVLTSRGRPKAAIVSIEDYQKLEAEKVQGALAGLAGRERRAGGRDPHQARRRGARRRRTVGRVSCGTGGT